MADESKSVGELYRELRNLAGLCVVVFAAVCVYFIATATPDDLARFGLYLIVLGVLFALLGIKTLQIRGWVQ
ncbi:MAG: hypothetical protein ACW99U_11055 [Candidatus Thorarchaeota archaeon]|jgi:hypothetical protein